MRHYLLPEQYDPDSLNRTLIELSTKLEQLAAEVATLKNPLDRPWMTPQQVERHSGGKYSADEVIAVCERKLQYPADLSLKIGDHIKFSDNGRGRFFKVYYPEFDRVMVSKMKNS